MQVGDEELKKTGVGMAATPRSGAASNGTPWRFYIGYDKTDHEGVS